MKHRDVILKTLFYLGLLLLFLLMALCSHKPPAFDPLDYFPLAEGNQWLFSGDLQVLTIKEIKHIEKSLQATAVFSDTLLTPLWRETYLLKDGQLQWTDFEPATQILPKVTFEPPLPAAPFSVLVGDVRKITGVEIRIDSTGATKRVPITVEYRINAVENVETPVGSFENCIKMTSEFQYPSADDHPLFVDRHIWWFAKSVGPVKYELPSSSGELIGFKLH
ncbi:MAG: hypothetical protein ONA69_03440 [candidate division KSB1 bacterium]|nr:hypothetical protein [candidate division KSB1 bacterium]MDZ7345825.1 hypothetical protein [candidate division KSB1 bacterium]